MYYPSITLDINEPFAIENPYEGKPETPVLATYAEGIHLITYSNSIDADLPIWGSHTLALCLTEFDSIPFLALIFDNSPVALLYSLNVYQIIGDERGPWLRSISTTVNILLVDNLTGKLACVRTLETKMLATLRHICREQLKAYSDAEQIQTRIETLLNPPAPQEPVNIVRVHNRAKLSNLFVLQYPISKPAEN